jgi:DNA-directed RNA polymerase II subunit RPB1
MNIFIPQSDQAQLELAYICDVKKQIISIKDSKPIIKLVQDSIVGAFKMTEMDKVIDKRNVMNIITGLYKYQEGLNLPLINKDLKYSELFSYVMPNNMNLSIKMDENMVKIENGSIKNGIISSKFLNDYMISYIVDKYCNNKVYNGYESAQIFIDNVQKLITQFMMIEGTTIGLGDCIASDKIIDGVKNMMVEKKMKINAYITEYENRPDSNDPETFEKFLFNELSPMAGNW